VWGTPAEELGEEKGFNAENVEVRGQRGGETVAKEEKRSKEVRKCRSKEKGREEEREEFLMIGRVVFEG
jgi:hypothetical protein